MEASQVKTSQTVVVDATGQIGGRLSSRVAKMLLMGQRVVVVNSESSLLSGDRGMIIGEWSKRLELGGGVHPRHGPFHHRRPDGILTRMIRGMLPRREPHGEEALKRLRVYVGVPSAYRSAPKTVFEDSKATKPKAFYLTLGELAKAIGWKGGEE